MATSAGLGNLVLKFEVCLLSDSSIDSSDITLGTHVLLHLCKMLIGDLDVLHTNTVSLGKCQSMTGILSCKINSEQRLLTLVVIALAETVAVRSIRTGEHGLDELMQSVGSKT